MVSPTFLHWLKIFPLQTLLEAIDPSSFSTETHMNPPPSPVPPPPSPLPRPPSPVPHRRQAINTNWLLTESNERIIHSQAPGRARRSQGFS